MKKPEDDFMQQEAGEKVAPKHIDAKMIANMIINILCVVLVIFALVVAIFTIVRSVNGDNLTKIGKNIYMTVMSDSMEPTFKASDVIIVKAYEGDGSDLKEGQVITFHDGITIDGKRYQGYNTHRITEVIKYENGLYGFRTKGDNVSQPDGSVRMASEIVGTWGTVDKDGNFTKGKVMKGLGSFSKWLQHPEKGKTRFFLVIVLPLILLFVAYAFVLVRTLVIAKLNSKKQVVGEPVGAVDSMSDEEKRRLAQQLLASLGATAPTPEPVPAAEPVEAVEPAAEPEAVQPEEAATSAESEAVQPEEAAEPATEPEQAETSAVSETTPHEATISQEEPSHPSDEE